MPLWVIIWNVFKLHKRVVCSERISGSYNSHYDIIRYIFRFQPKALWNSLFNVYNLQAQIGCAIFVLRHSCVRKEKLKSKRNLVMVTKFWYSTAWCQLRVVIIFGRRSITRDAVLRSVKQEIKGQDTTIIIMQPAHYYSDPGSGNRFPK